MENKKSSLLTVFLVITIILIVVMGALLYMQKTEADKQIAELENNAGKLQETINDLQGKIDSISNTINDKENTSSNEKNLKQFDVEFYELKDIAKEYRDYENVKNYKDFIYDLDGDGTNEKITLSLKTGEVENRENYSVKLNGEIFSEGTSMDSIYIVDLNENDKKIEVVIFDDGPSDDPNYTIYSKDGNKMVELKNIGGYPLKNDKKGTILVKDIYNGVTVPEIYLEYYIIQDGKIEMKNVDVEKIKDVELKTSHLYFSEDYTSKDKIFDEIGGDYNNIGASLKKVGIEQLNNNKTFKIINITPEDDYGYEYKIYVELSDGRKGYIFHIQWAG